jgi:adenylate cyclase
VKFFAKHWARIAVTLLPLLFALGHATNVLNISLVQTLDNAIYDAKLRARMPRTLDPRIVVVDVDEKSLSEIGRWPWSRNKLAALTDELFQNQNIALLGFDLVFAEADGSSGLQQFKQLAENELSTDQPFQTQYKILEPMLDFDAQFAQALQQKKVVLSYYFTSDRQARQSGVLPLPVITQKNANHAPFRTTVWDGFGSNIENIAAAAPHAGFFNAIADDDGVVRSIPLLASYKGDYYESLALALYRATLNFPTIAPTFTSTVTPGYSGTASANNIESIKLSNAASNTPAKTIKVDDRAAVLVPYRGLGGAMGGSYQYISASDVLNKRIVAQALSGKIILIGSSAPGLQDLRITPVGQTYPGVETHANLLSSMLDGQSIFTPDYALGVEVALLLLVGLALAFVLPALTAMRALGFSLAMLLVPLALNMYLFVEHGMVFPLATLILLSLFAYMLNMSYGYFVESKAKRELSKLFGSYVPPQLVEEMLLEPSNHTMKATNKELTVMFCDLRGFTQLAEDMEPTQLQHLLNGIFGRLTQLIVGRRGTVDKYMGDCVMAFWGAPVGMANHAELAVLTALDITQAIKLINQEHLARGLPAVKLGIGINTGTMCVGDMGSFMRRSYTVVGDAVNIASRLESLTKKYEVPILAGPNTKRDAPQFKWLEIDQVQLAGKNDIFTVFTPIDGNLHKNSHSSVIF